MFSKKASLEFEGVKSINSTTYLSEMLKKLEEPPHVNSLEVEARDLVTARLDLVTEELRQLRKERTRKRKKPQSNCKAENHNLYVQSRGTIVLYLINL